MNIRTVKIDLFIMIGLLGLSFVFDMFDGEIKIFLRHLILSQFRVITSVIISGISIESMSFIVIILDTLFSLSIVILLLLLFYLIVKQALLGFD